MTDEQKPWEKNGEPFNEETAWNLIQNLRAEKQELQTKNSSLTEERDAIAKQRDEYSTTVEEQKATLQLANDDLAERQKNYEQLETLRTKENLLVEQGLPRDFASYIPDGDEETMTSAVEKFASLRGTETASAPPNPAQVAEPAQDPDAEAAAFFEGLMNR